MLFHRGVDMVEIELGWCITGVWYARYLFRVDTALCGRSWSASERCSRREGLLLDLRRCAALEARLSLVAKLPWILLLLWCYSRLWLLLIPCRLLCSWLMLLLLALEGRLGYPSVCLSSCCRRIQCMMCMSVLLLMSGSSMSVPKAHVSHLPRKVLRAIAIAVSRHCGGSGQTPSAVYIRAILDHDVVKPRYKYGMARMPRPKSKC